MISSHGDTNSRSTCWLPSPLLWSWHGYQQDHSAVEHWKGPQEQEFHISLLWCHCKFCFSLFHHLMEPLAASLWCTGASCDCGCDWLHFQAERIASCTQPCEDQRSKLESLHVQTFTYTLTMVSNQLCWSTSIHIGSWIQIKYILNQYKTGPVQEFSHSEYADNWQQLYNMFNQWSKKPDCIDDWHQISKDSGTRAVWVLILSLFMHILTLHFKCETWDMSEYACKLRLIVSQTQVDFKAREYIDPAYITYIHDRVLRQLYKKLKHRKSQK